jgi:hypothetical protein
MMMPYRHPSMRQCKVRAFASRKFASSPMIFSTDNFRRMLWLGVAFILAAATWPANAAPPEGADPRYAPFFQALQRKDKGGGSCCGVADCREVRSQSPENSGDGNWRVFIDKETFGPNAPDDWIIVPKETVDDQPTTSLRPPNAIACWQSGNYYLNGVLVGSPGGRLICFKVPAPSF